jgi:hypothetical protein
MSTPNLRTNSPQAAPDRRFSSGLRARFACCRARLVCGQVGVARGVNDNRSRRPTRKRTNVLRRLLDLPSGPLVTSPLA